MHPALRVFPEPITVSAPADLLGFVSRKVVPCRNGGNVVFEKKRVRGTDDFYGKDAWTRTSVIKVDSQADA